MIRLFGPLLMLAGALTFFVGQWIALEVYISNKLSKINQNTALFLSEFYQGKSLVKLPNPHENVFSVRTAEGKIITTGNILNPVKAEDFVSAYHGESAIEVYVYTRKASIGEYFSTMTQKPFALGVSISGLILFLVGVFMTLRGKGDSEEVVRQKEDLIKRLKATRTALAMGGVIPQEGLEEAKAILDDIIKRVEGKS